MSFPASKTRRLNAESVTDFLLKESDEGEVILIFEHTSCCRLMVISIF